MALTVLAGPLALVRCAPAKAGLLLFFVVLLTVISQIGGLVLWFCMPVFGWLNRRFGDRNPALRGGACLGLLVAAYLGASIVAIPISGAFGRVPLDCGLTGAAPYGPRTILTCLLNRHYATLPARQALQKISTDIEGARVVYLDAGFPFFDWFPMIPHISHGDGRKIDLALVYVGGAATPSPVGYFGFEQPRPGDPQPCDGREGWLRWDMAWLRPLLPETELDEYATAELLGRLAPSLLVRRILIEPHLKIRLGLDHPKLRFQGCAAARHDDHIHVEFNAN